MIIFVQYNRMKKAVCLLEVAAPGFPAPVSSAWLTEGLRINISPPIKHSQMEDTYYIPSIG